MPGLPAPTISVSPFPFLQLILRLPFSFFIILWHASIWIFYFSCLKLFKASWIYGLMSFVIWEKLSTIISLDVVSDPFFLPSFWDSCYIFIRPCPYQTLSLYPLCPFIFSSLFSAFFVSPCISLDIFFLHPKSLIFSFDVSIKPIQWIPHFRNCFFQFHLDLVPSSLLKF